MRRVLQRWWPSLLIGASFLFVVITDLWAGVPLLTWVIPAVLLVAAWVVSPLFFPRSTELGQAERRAADRQAPLIFWKPGCSYCIWMRLALGGAARGASWIDVQSDGEAALVVREVNQGNLTTPTVMFGDQTRTNPSPSWVREQVARARSA